MIVWSGRCFKLNGCNAVVRIRPVVRIRHAAVESRVVWINQLEVLDEAVGKRCFRLRWNLRWLRLNECTGAVFSKSIPLINLPAECCFGSVGFPDFWVLL